MVTYIGPETPDLEDRIESDQRAKDYAERRNWYETEVERIYKIPEDKPYEILGLNENASDVEIRKKFRELQQRVASDKYEAFDFNEEEKERVKEAQTKLNGLLDKILKNQKDKFREEAREEATKEREKTSNPFARDIFEKSYGTSRLERFVEEIKGQYKQLSKMDNKGALKAYVESFAKSRSYDTIPEEKNSYNQIIRQKQIGLIEVFKYMLEDGVAQPRDITQLIAKNLFEKINLQEASIRQILYHTEIARVLHDVKGIKKAFGAIEEVKEGESDLWNEKRGEIADKVMQMANAYINLWTNYKPRPEHKSYFTEIMSVDRVCQDLKSLQKLASELGLHKINAKGQAIQGREESKGDIYIGQVADSVIDTVSKYITTFAKYSLNKTEKYVESEMINQIHKFEEKGILYLDTQHKDKATKRLEKNIAQYFTQYIVNAVEERAPIEEVKWAVNTVKKVSTYLYNEGRIKEIKNAVYVADTNDTYRSQVNHFFD